MVYTFDELDGFITDNLFIPSRIVRTRKSEYWNIPCSFDIETSSFYEKGGKRALMYVWQFGFNGDVLLGRTWEQFKTLLDTLSEVYGTGEGRRLVVYVHNLAYEFQFMRRRFEWVDGFNLETRVPIYQCTSQGFEFRCSYLLSNLPLSKVAANLQNHRIAKLSGDLDYNLIRTPETPLTEAEIGYCVNDVMILQAYISEQMEYNGDITKIPLTQTGFVRRFVRRKCYRLEGVPYRSKANLDFVEEYKRLMDSMTLEAEEYKQLKRAFQGGFVHCNAAYSRRVLLDVDSYDFTSSYPAVMLSEKFPMSKSHLEQPTTMSELRRLFTNYCCVFEVEFTDIRKKVCESYLSSSKCHLLEGEILDNGRVAFADRLKTTITNVDFDIIVQCYDYGTMRVSNVRCYDKGYLPKPVIEAVLKLYGDKTTLKGVAGKEAEYMKSKEMLNSCYGMSVTDIVRDTVIYGKDGWTVQKSGDIEEVIDKYNKSRNRFLFYPWGVFITAYARRNLFSGILACGADYIYSDTDSVKVLNGDNHREYFERYNRLIQSKCAACLSARGLDPALLTPQTIKGIGKPLGVWDYEGRLDEFKSIGAKRYLYRKGGECFLTCAGVNKKSALDYMVRTFGGDIFKRFDDDLVIPGDWTGKLVHTYIDGETAGDVVDYLGRSYHYQEESGVHLEKTAYSLSMSQAYLDYLKGYREVDR